MRKECIEIHISLIKQIMDFLSLNHVKHNIPQNLPEDETIKLQTMKAWIELSNYLSKLITNHSRTIHEADGFASTVQSLPCEIQEKLNTLIEKIRCGDNVNSHLTRQIFNAERFDYLLNQWNIKHLHISDSVDMDTNAMKENRAGYLLFLVISDSDAYLLEAIPHPHGAGFMAYHFLEILHDNGWLELAGLQRMNGVMNVRPDVKKDEDIYYLYRNNINVAFNFNDGCYMPIGVTAHGNKLVHSLSGGKLEKLLSDLPSDGRFVRWKMDAEKLSFVFRVGEQEYAYVVNV